MSDGGAKEQRTATRLKAVSLFVLIVQNASLAIMMRYSRVAAVGVLYIPSCVVVTTEVVKVLLSTCLLVHEKHGPQGALDALRKETWKDTLKVSVPAFLFTIQNLLLYVAADMMDAAITQVLYQLKLLFTALFSIAILGRVLSRLQWFALLVLGVGALLVERGASADSESDSDANVQSILVGSTAVVVAAISSGFTGVYFEKMLKKGEVSVWVRNIQLAAVSVIIGMGKVLWSDAYTIYKGGFFQGYDGLTWAIVINQAVGGLCVAVVVKYADNILKAFATSIAVLVTAMVSLMFLSFAPTPLFYAGALAILSATILYNAPIAAPPPPPAADAAADASALNKA